MRYFFAIFFLLIAITVYSKNNITKNCLKVENSYWTFDNGSYFFKEDYVTIKTDDNITNPYYDCYDSMLIGIALDNVSAPVFYCFLENSIYSNLIGCFAPQNTTILTKELPIIYNNEHLYDILYDFISKKWEMSGYILSFYNPEETFSTKGKFNFIAGTTQMPLFYNAETIVVTVLYGTKNVCIIKSQTAYCFNKYNVLKFKVKK